MTNSTMSETVRSLYKQMWSLTCTMQHHQRNQKGLFVLFCITYCCWNATRYDRYWNDYSTEIIDLLGNILDFVCVENLRKK